MSVFKKVGRREYGKFIRSHDLTDIPTENQHGSIMLHSDGNGRLMAQAIYPKPARGFSVVPCYEIRRLTKDK